MSEPPISPITGSERVDAVDTLEPQELIRRWADEFGVDIADQLKGIERVQLFRCLDTGLEFYRPAELAGSSGFYARLQDFPWYYRSDRWEHRRAIERFEHERRVLEVGAGSGIFARRLRDRMPEVEYVGLELNPRAVEQAQAENLPIERRTLETEAANHANYYDLVCSFQVLEHVPYPGDFLRAQASAVRPGGRILVGVPDQRSYLGDLGLLLDRPPHHMSHWSEDVLRAAAPHFGCDTEWVEREPLQPYQVSVWVDGWFARQSKRTRWAGPALRVVGAPLARAYVGARRHRYTGEVLLASFVKRARVDPPARLLAGVPGASLGKVS